LTADEVIDLVKPTDSTIALVHEWLAANGISDYHSTPAKDWIHVRIPVSTAERLLNTEYHLYSHTEDGSHIIRTTSWSLPQHLHAHIDTIQPTTSFFRARALSTDYITSESEPWVSPTYAPPSNETLDSVCNITRVSPQCFMTLYGTKGYTPLSNISNSIGFNNFLGQIPIRPDTRLFLELYRPDAVTAADTFQQLSIAAGPVQDGPLNFSQAAHAVSQEANLDVETIAAMVWPIPITSYSTGGSPPFDPDLQTVSNTNEPYLEWVNYVLGLDEADVLRVISTSYGDDEQSVPASYAVRVCQQFAALGARGVSLLFASGDLGVGPGNGDCKSNDGENRTMFIPQFPASCPFVTTVGATHEFSPEVVAYFPGRNLSTGNHTNPYSSGGGFSNYFPAPRYQQVVVEEYIKGLNGSFDGLYNKSGRGYPDVSAQGQYFAYVWNGTVGSISGTSASTPLMASVIALVNDALLRDGKPVMGWLNPWLYKEGWRAFRDVTAGSAVGCDLGFGGGFPATEGWDAVTGWGTPEFSALVELAKCRKGRPQTNGVVEGVGS
jgi:tripeptidyl-peptidase-1